MSASTECTPEHELADLRTRLGEVGLLDAHRLERRLDRVRRKGSAGAVEGLAAELARAEERIARRRAILPEVAYPPELPVSARREDLLAAVRDHQVVVVAGETGSGKTTQLPKICLELGRGVRGQIAHTQPRRIAARTVADRIAHELGVAVGDAVGFAVRFDDRSSDDTLVKLMTDGLLLAEIQRDRLLRRYDTIIVDEAHERSLNVDFLLGYLKSILPRRPDLKVVITSATIDPERFARHFGDDVPVVEVSGRTHPVEVRYRRDPQEDGFDQVEAIADAVDELQREQPGDVLVFLSGEREIRDTADALRGRFPDLDVLPLYARLSSAEQQRVFQPHGTRRVVLATNVAETSLTVPGIRYVVDPGTARISRYNSRLKVQRLPIEPVSQASADQRKGRCGRTSNGICVRLYTEEDFLERPRFTDPEILRTSLAAVILQMASVGLGDIEAFPFLDPPDRRQVRDGISLLHELGALDAEGRLTPLGRRLAQLPVDPRLGRMVLEAGRLGCADEVIVIAAALSIQDPRERPAEQQAQADRAHARFRDDTSDFLAYLNLWRHLREQQRALSGSAFRKRCKAEHLHVLRVREWQDLASQLRQAAKGAGVAINRTPAEPNEIHVALLSGLLSHLGLRDVSKREYVGARGARFAVFPGSALARKQPDWVMVAELVETSRLWGRTAAKVQPRWIEPLAGHLVTRSHSAPHWSKRRAAAVATERVTLYGLPIVTGRKVPYAPLNPEVSRELFIRSALVDGQWHARHAFLARNRELIEEVRGLEERARRRDIFAGEEAIFAFYDARIPDQVLSGADFDRWWRDESRRQPDLLTLPYDVLVRREAAGALDQRANPAAWRQGEVALPLTYRFEPGAQDDGVTVHVPLQALGQVRGDEFEWLVPALREELVTVLIRSLPKDIRRALVPAPELARQVLARLRPRREPLLGALARELERLRGVRIPPDAWDLSRLPPHLRMRFRVHTDDGSTVAHGEDLPTLRAAVRPRLQAELAKASGGLERHGLRDWTIGELPRTVALPGTGRTVRAYPALVDEGETVGVRVLDTPVQQQAAMHLGTRRLLRLTVPSALKRVQAGLSSAAQLSLVAAPHGSAGAVLEDCETAALDALVAEAGGPAWDEPGFRRLRDHVAGRLAGRTAEIVGRVVKILDAERAVLRALESVTMPEGQPACRDVARQLGRLIPPGFVTAAGAGRLADVERYVRGAAVRLERLGSAVATDRDRMTAIRAIEDEYAAIRDLFPAGQPIPEPLREARWMLEELRLSQLAPGVAVRGPVSAKRVRRLLEAART